MRTNHYSNYSESYQSALTDAQSRAETLKRRGAELVRDGFLPADWLRHCLTLADVSRAVEDAAKRAAEQDASADTLAENGTTAMLRRMNAVEMVQRRGTVLTPYGWRKPDHHYVVVDGVYTYKQ